MLELGLVDLASGEPLLETMHGVSTVVTSASVAMTLGTDQKEPDETDQQKGEQGSGTAAT